MIGEAKLKKSLDGSIANDEYRFTYGEIIRVSEVRWGPGDYETHCLIRYVVAGKSHFKVQKSLWGCGDTGDEVGLYYEVKDPGHAVIPDQYEPPENTSLGYLIGGVALFGVGLFYLVCLIASVLSIFFAPQTTGHF